jgi:hypothetical protein
MKQEINRFTAYTNCPSGEYWAAFCNSEVKKYPKGWKEIISFLILNEDKKTPRLNNKGEPYYSTIICNQSKGSNPKSKVSKIKKAMLSKEEYDPLDIHLGLPNISYFFKRIMKVRVTTKETGMNFITHIQRPRDNQWECIEGEFEGIYFKDPYKLYLKLKHKIRRIERGGCEEDIQYYLLDKTMPYVDSEGNFTGVIDNDKYNNLDKYRKQRADEFYKRLVNFVESENINDLFPHSI